VNAGEIARRLGGEVSGRDAVLCPGPGHSPKDRSLSVKLDPTAPDGFLTHSHAGDDRRLCRDHFRERLGLPRWEPSDEQRRGLHTAIRWRRSQSPFRKQKPPHRAQTATGLKKGCSSTMKNSQADFLPDHHRNAPVRCPVCDKRVQRQARQQTYCSRKCRQRAHYDKSVAEGPFDPLLGKDTGLPTNPLKSPAISVHCRRQNRGRASVFMARPG
jgi:hypothetical protein